MGVGGIVKVGGKLKSIDNKSSCFFNSTCFLGFFRFREVLISMKSVGGKATPTDSNDNTISNFKIKEVKKQTKS